MALMADIETKVVEPLFLLHIGELQATFVVRKRCVRRRLTEAHQKPGTNRIVLYYRVLLVRIRLYNMHLILKAATTTNRQFRS